MFHGRNYRGHRGNYSSHGGGQRRIKEGRTIRDTQGGGYRTGETTGYRGATEGSESNCILVQTVWMSLKVLQ